MNLKIVDQPVAPRADAKRDAAAGRGHQRNPGLRSISTGSSACA